MSMPQNCIFVFVTEWTLEKSINDEIWSIPSQTQKYNYAAYAITPAFSFFHGETVVASATAGLVSGQ